MRTLLLLALLCACTASAQSTSVNELKKAPAKEYPCDVEILDPGAPLPESLVGRPNEKLCIIEANETPAFGWEDPFANAMKKLQKAACKCGADAIVLKLPLSATKKRGQVRLEGTAIRWTGPPVRPTPVPPSGVELMAADGVSSVTDMMNRKDWASAGMDKLTRDERRALDAWFYTLILSIHEKAARESCGKPCP